MNTKSYNKNILGVTDACLVKDICIGIKQMRLNRNLSQQELAHRSGISRITISKMEAGRAPTLLTLVQVLRALDKLELLSIFSEEPEISPMRLLKQQEKQRKKASPKARTK